MKGSGAKRDYVAQRARRLAKGGKYLTNKGYRGGRNLWRSGFGYGYGAYLAFQHGWMAAALPYDQWFPQGQWIPSYTVEQRYIEQYNDQGQAIPDNAYQVNPEFGQADLPPLPTFAAQGIDLTPLSETGDSLTPQQEQVVTRLKDAISVDLQQLQQQYKAQVAQGYFIVPDLDRARFSWVKRV